MSRNQTNVSETIRLSIRVNDSIQRMAEFTNGNIAITFSRPTSDEYVQPHEAMVRMEEVVIVSAVLFVWIGLILFFIKQWGKIRMLEPSEPYQPTFQEPEDPLALVGRPRLKSIEPSKVALSVPVPISSRKPSLATEKKVGHNYVSNDVSEPCTRSNDGNKESDEGQTRSPSGSSNELLLNRTWRRYKSVEDINLMLLHPKASTKSSQMLFA